VATLKSMGCGRIAGNWNWVFNGQVFFKPDGSYSYDVAGNSGTGRWTCSNGNHYVLRSGANEDRMDLAEDGNTMTGVSSVTGFTIGFTVHRK